MGIPIFKFSSNTTNHCTEETPIEETTPNPNPFKFKILKNSCVNGKSILLVNYQGCVTFNGNKLLLLKSIWTDKASLDPHLLGDW